MYALYLAGRIVERWYGSLYFLVFYLTCAAAGSDRQLRLRRRRPSVGASGAIFGLFGLLLAAGRIHHPVDRQSRASSASSGCSSSSTSLFGFAVTGIDNAAHLGGLVAGLWLGASSRRRGSRRWPRCGSAAREAGAAHVAKVPVFAPVIGIGVVAVVVVAG